MSRASVYLDYNATALVRPEAAAAVAQLTRSELLQVPNFGRGALKALAIWLASCGFELSPEIPAGGATPRQGNEEREQTRCQ